MNELDDFIKWIGCHTCRYDLCPKCEGIKAKKASFCKNCFILPDRSGTKNSFYGKHHSKVSRQRMTISRTGKGNAFYGKKHSEKTKRKISTANGGKNSHWFGKKRPEHSNFMMGRKRNPEYIEQFLSGKNNPNWRGGLSLELYGEEFNEELKRMIRIRDDYMCQFCGIEENDREFPVHHIDYEKKNADPLNLITLCDLHHGESNFNREKWQFFYETYQEIRMIQ